MKQNKQPQVELTAEGQLFVKMPTGKTITFDMKASDTIGNIKQNIKATTHIPYKLQCITHIKKASYLMVPTNQNKTKQSMNKQSNNNQQPIKTNMIGPAAQRWGQAHQESGAQEGC